MTENNIYNPEYVRNLFNEMAQTYDRVNYITSFGFSLRWRIQFINKIKKDNKDIKVLDLMTGMGETWDIIKNNFPNATIDALDYSDTMVEKATIKKSQLNLSHLNVIHENILKNKIESNSYDVITCAFGIKTFDKLQTEQFAKQVYRILKPGGYITFIEISVPQNIILKDPMEPTYEWEQEPKK